MRRFIYIKENQACNHTKPIGDNNSMQDNCGITEDNQSGAPLEVEMIKFEAGDSKWDRKFVMRTTFFERSWN